MCWHSAKSDIISPRQSNTQAVLSPSANTIWAFWLACLLTTDKEWEYKEFKREGKIFTLSEVKCGLSLCLCVRLVMWQVFLKKKKTSCMIIVDCKNIQYTHTAYSAEYSTKAMLFLFLLLLLLLFFLNERNLLTFLWICRQCWLNLCAYPGAGLPYCKALLICLQ